MLHGVDQNVSAVLIAAVTVLGGFLTAVVVARIAAHSTRGLERDRWTRELCASFIHATNESRDAIRIIVMGGPSRDGWSHHLTVAQKALLEIKMVAPSLRDDADRVWEACNALRLGVLKLDEATDTPAGPRVPIDRTRYVELDDAYRVAMLAFVAKVAEDLD